MQQRSLTPRAHASFQSLGLTRYPTQQLTNTDTYWKMSTAKLMAHKGYAAVCRANKQ